MFKTNFRFVLFGLRCNFAKTKLPVTIRKKIWTATDELVQSDKNEDGIKEWTAKKRQKRNNMSDWEREKERWKGVCGRKSKFERGREGGREKW
jgi:hypothetical protein